MCGREEIEEENFRRDGKNQRPFRGGMETYYSGNFLGFVKVIIIRTFSNGECTVSTNFL